MKLPVRVFLAMMCAALIVSIPFFLSSPTMLPEAQEELVRAGVLPADYDFEGHRELVGMQAGDVPVTYADSAALEADYGFTPKIGIREGLRAFAEWYAEYYK